ncbi:hypothetical protein V8E53_003080 [Lactarius tabidus]
MKLSTPEPSVCTPPPKPISPDAVGVGHRVNHTTFGDLNLPSSASPAPLLNAILTTGHPLSMLAPATSSPCRPWEPGSAADGEDSATAAALFQDKGKDILHDDVIIVTPDTPLQSPPTQPIFDEAIASLSRSS